MDLYTTEELNLQRKIEINGSEKEMIFTHTNIKAGNVKVIKRDVNGNIAGNMDKFNIH